MISITVSSSRAVIEFATNLVWEEEDRWRQALEMLAEAGPAALLQALDLTDEPEEEDAWQRPPEAKPAHKAPRRSEVEA